MNNDELLQRRRRVLGQHTMLFYDQPVQIVRGEGVYVWDADGKKYLDTYNNVPHVGHCHPRVVDALCSQARTLNTHTRYLHENVVRYAERLTAKFDSSLAAAMFMCTGSEANEQALRMARHCTGHQGIIVTELAYHGNTEAVAELGAGFMPEAARTKRVKTMPIPDTYNGLPGVVAADLKQACLDAVRAAIDAFEAEGLGTAGILLCPDFANEGLVYPPQGFLAEAVALVREAGGVFIADEVQGGFGRTGRQWWSHEIDGVIPDIVTLGKPMGNGHPLAGLVTTDELLEQFGQWGLYFNTFGGNPVSCAVGMAVLDVIEEENLLHNATEMGAFIAAGLRELQGRFEIIGDVRDKGLFFALEMVQDRAARTPATALTNRVVNDMKERGVLLSKIGRHDNILKIRPPMPVAKSDAEFFLETFEQCLAAL